MIKIENIQAFNFEGAMRGMRNPMNSWHLSDTICGVIGPNDLDLAKRLANAGPDHRKYARQIMVSMDITAPLFWWKEFDTYKVGTVANSCSTMHKLTSLPLTTADFTFTSNIIDWGGVIRTCNNLIANFNHTKDPEVWRTLIEFLPSGYNQTRTVTMNYEVILNMVRQRKNHKLTEWREFCSVVPKQLPHFEELFEGLY